MSTNFSVKLRTPTGATAVPMVIVKSTQEVDWPKTYLNSKKPEIRIPSDSQYDNNSAHAKLMTDLTSGICDTNLIKHYIHHNLPLFEVTSPNAWSSFGQTIAAAQAKTNPTDIYTAITGPTYSSNHSSNPASVTADQHKGLVVYLISIYRPLRFQGAKHSQAHDLFQNISVVLSNQFPFVSTLPGPNQGDINQFTPLKVDQSYRALVAAFDMFCFKFGSEIPQILRIGSLVTHFEDCAAIHMLKTLSNYLGLDEKEAAHCVFHQASAVELTNMYRDLTEMGREDSYLPYSSALGIVNRSPWSVTANQSIFTYTMAIGAFLNQTRAINARMMTGIQTDAICTIALKVAAALQGVNEMDIYLTHAGSSYDSALGSGTTGSALAPSQTASERLFNMATANANRKLFVKQLKITVGRWNVRPDTLGEFLQRWIQTQN